MRGRRRLLRVLKYKCIKYCLVLGEDFLEEVNFRFLLMYRNFLVWLGGEKYRGEYVLFVEK